MKSSAKTSLSQQLSRLRVPQTSAHKERKGSVSFLYDFLESQSIDNDMHYAIAISGLQSLIDLDQSIDRFRQTLFNESSKTLDRGLQSREVNQHLDTEIEAYLFAVVSNYFLLNSTHKTIEWLIHRYSINEYNTDALIASVIPYHETRLFARLLQTCGQIKVETSKWFWLKPIQISGSPLPKTTLITHCISETGFLRFICDNLLKCLKIDPKNSSFFTFFVSTLINVIERNTNESIVSIIIGYVMKGIKSKNECFRKASLSITAHICTRIVLEKKIVLKFLNSMTKTSETSMNDELLITLSIIGRNQSLDVLPQSLLFAINENLLLECNEKHCIENLVCLVLKSLLKSCTELQFNDKLMNLLNKMTLTSQSVDTCVQTISICLTQETTRVAIDTYEKVVSLIESRYPDLFEESLSKLDSMSSIGPLLGAFRYSFLKDSKVPLIFGLNHINQTIQMEAIDHLIKNFDVMIEQRDELTILTVKNMLTNVFNQKSPQILISIFGLKQKMFKIFSEEEMRDICLNLLNCCQLKEENSVEENDRSWYQLRNSILATYCSSLSNSTESLFVSIHPYLLPLNESDLVTLAIILDSNSAKIIQILTQLRKKCKNLIESDVSETNIDSLVSIISNKMAKYYTENNEMILENAFIHSNPNVNLKLKSYCLSLLTLERIHTLSTDNNIKQKSANILLNLIEKIIKTTKITKSKHSLEKLEDFIHSCLKSIRKNRMNLSNIIYIINSLMVSLDPSFAIKSQTSVWFWFNELSSNNYYYKLFLILFNNCYENNKSKSNTFRETLIRFIKKVFSVFGYNFFAPLWVNENVLLQTRALEVTSHLSNSNTSTSDISVLCLLISMHSPISNCRESALITAKSVNKQLNNSLLNSCLVNSESIKNDENSVSYVIADWFKSNKEKKIKTENESILLQNQLMAILKEVESPEHIKSGVILLLNKCDKTLLIDIIINMRSYLDITSPNSSQMKIIESLSTIYLEPTVFLNSDSENDVLFNYLVKCLQTNCSQEISLNLINTKLFDAICFKNSKICLLNELLEITVKQNNKIANKKLKKLLKCGDLISSLLEFVLPIDDLDECSEPKPKRVQLNESHFSLESSHWKKFIVLLEIIKTKKKLTNISVLVKNLFDYLKMTFIIDSKSSLEYLRQLLLSSLINCMKQNENELPSLPIESVIECLRESQQRETQKIALILISSFAQHFKKEILDYVITIFTFIGTNLLHCDDQYTIEIVMETLETIIPILLDHVNNNKDIVINVFIDSLPDIPSHRRLHLFRKLLNILGEREHLWILLMKIIERTFNKSKLEREPFFSLIVALSSHCDIIVQIDSLNQLIKVFAEEYCDERRALMNINQNISETDRRLIAQSLCQLILKIVSSQDFITNIVNSEWTLIGEQLLAFLHRLISLIAKYTSNENEAFVKESNAHRRRVRNLLYQTLMKFNSLLPNQQLFELVIQLLKSDSYLIQRKALELLNEKLGEIPNQKLTSLEINPLFECLSSFIPSVDSINQMDEHYVYNSQLSMITLKLLSKNIENNDENQKHLNILIQQIILLINAMKPQISVNFKASAILCLTQLMVTLSNNAIPLIPSIIPIILNNFTISDEVITISSITSVSKISENFSQFLSPYLDQIIVKLLNAYNNSPQIKSRLKPIWSCFAKLIPKRLLLNSIDSCYTEVSAISLEALCELMGLLKLSLEKINSKSDVNNVHKYVKNLMLKALDYRNINRNQTNLNEINNYEDCCNQSFSVFIPKMTEILFRPLFYRLYDWAIRDKDGKLYYRMISFYRLMEFLADKLKSLFCLFIGPSIVNNCSHLLTLFHSDNQSSNIIDSKTCHQLIRSLLTTLSKCFMYDINGSFLNKDRMEALAKPIVNQLTNTLGTDEEYKERIETLCLCTQYLIQSHKDETVIKDFNYQILLKTRETSTEVRFGALQVLHRLILVCGEQYLPYIPETIPFISELSEDDSNEIEELVKTVITDLEHILGEPINKYL